MQGKLSNASLVAVLVLAFTLFVAGLTNSTDGERIIQAGAATPTPTRTPTPVNIGNKVWEDINPDGLQNAGEPGVAGVTVELWNQDKTAVLASTVSNASGAYSVVAPLPGFSYFLRFVPPAGYSFTTPNVGADDLVDSDANADGFTDVIAIPPNLISTTIWDVGLRKSAYAALTPARLIDTRGGPVAAGVTNQPGQLAANATLTLQVAGLGGVPVGAKAATLNVLSVEPAGIGYLTVYPCDKPQPTASSLNMTNVNVANELSAPLSAAGTVCIFTSIPTHLIVDVAGAFLG